MRKNEMINIQMSKEEAKEISSYVMEAFDKVEEMYEVLDDIFELLSPVIMFAEQDDSFQEESEADKSEAGDDQCKDCELPCEQNPKLNDGKEAEDTEEESEEEVLAIELLKAVFSALTDLLENGE